jgi:hypothetical protein
MNPCEMETGLDVSCTKEDYDGRKTDTCIIDVDVDLKTKIYWHFMSYWFNLIHDNVYGLNDCGTIPCIILSLFYDDTLASMTKIWRKFAEKLIHWN